MKSDKSILMALMDEMEALTRTSRPSPAKRLVAWIAGLVVAVLGAGAAYALLGRSRRTRIQRRIAAASRTSVRRVRNGLADLGVLHPRRSRGASSNGTRARSGRRTSRAGSR